MAVFFPPSARLHDLIGDAVLDLPAHLVERLERALTEPRGADLVPAFRATAAQDA